MEKIITDAARVLISLITLLFVSFVISSVSLAHPVVSQSDAVLTGLMIELRD